MADKYVLTDEGMAARHLVEQCDAFHDNLVTEVTDRWRAFEGELAASDDAAQWQSQLHPPFIRHIVETNIAGLLDGEFAFKVKPAPRLYSEQEWQWARDGAEAHEMLFHQQLKHDRFDEFQRPFVLQAAVARFSVAKTIASFDGGKFTGPTTECVDVRDFYYHEAARGIDDARWVAHETWVSFADIMALAKRGIYKEDAARTLEQPQGDSQDDELERRREKRGRRKDMISVLEIWNRETKRVITLGARRVVLREADWPFEHGKYPFVTASLQPFPFSIQGTSVVEKLADLQAANWDLMNQRHDNLRLLNNAVIVRQRGEDLDDQVWGPGEQWEVDGDPNTAVKILEVSPIPAQISLPAEAQLQQLMQNLGGGQPFTSTSEANTIGANTATEAALVTNLAQQSIKQMKLQLNLAYERIGWQRMKLNQQFVTRPMYVEQIGLDSQQEIQTVFPELLKGEFYFDITPMNESLMRSERRAEAGALLQVVGSQLPVWVALAQGGAATAPNFDEFMRYLLEQYDLGDIERFFSRKPPPGQTQLPQPNQNQGGGQPGGPNLGVTSPLAAGPQSPSSQASLSPEVFQQRNLAMTGGVSNSG